MIVPRQANLMYVLPHSEPRTYQELADNVAAIKTHMDQVIINLNGSGSLIPAISKSGSFEFAFMMGS